MFLSKYDDDIDNWKRQKTGRALAVHKGLVQQVKAPVG